MNEERESKDSINANDLDRVIAANRSFIGASIATLALYFFFYIPGFIANVVYLNSALNVKRKVGQAPEGFGCLIALLVMFVVPPVIWLFFMMFVAYKWSGWENM